MQTVRLPLLRGALFIIALAAIAFILARGDNPAQATTYNPQFSVSVSDPNPGANADLTVNFSLEAPDSFPNVRTNSSIQFIPKAWGVDPTAPVGGIGGTFNALSTLGLFGVSACYFAVPVPFTMIDATVDTTHLASELDLGAGMGPGGTHAHPGGPGYTGQFVDDPETLQTPGDLGLSLLRFNADEKYIRIPWQVNGPYDESSSAYRDVDGNNRVSAGDVRLTDYPPVLGGLQKKYLAGSVVQAGEDDQANNLELFPFNTWRNSGVKHSNPDGNGQMDAGENVYKDQDYSGTVSYGDIRLFPFAQLAFGSTVQKFSLPGGVSRYPDFLNQIFPPAVVGEPLARQWGGQMVAGMSAVSLNIVTFRPGQLPGYPAQLGYPNVVILLNPAAPVDIGIINLTSDLCTPLSLTSTNFGVSHDNPSTLDNETGHTRLTNPKAEKSHDFTLITISQPDADDDGIENMLDTCPFDRNIENLDERGDPRDRTVNPDGDVLDGACDPVSYPPSDFGTALISFNANEFHNGSSVLFDPGAGFTQAIYRDMDGSRSVSAGDLRLTQWRTPGSANFRPAGTTVAAGDEELTSFNTAFRRFNEMHSFDKHADGNANGQMDPGEAVYRDWDNSGNVTLGDNRLFAFEGSAPGSAVVYHSPSSRGPVFSSPDEDIDNYGNRADNCATVANGIEVLAVDYVVSGQFSFFILGGGDLIGPSNQLDTDGDDIGDACEGAEHGAQCANDVDDDGDGAVNDGCALDQGIRGETGAQCENAIDDDGDGRINDGCPERPNAETGEQCLNAVDDDGDGKVNDGCPWVGGAPERETETSTQCNDAVDDDGDGVVNDGCPQYPLFPSEVHSNDPNACLNDVDDDWDGYVNDGCPMVGSPGSPETGDQCANATDDDDDGLVNDGCPVVDPGDVAKTTFTGHEHVVALTQGVPIAKHGVKLDDLEGPGSVAADGSATFNLSVENKSDSAEDAAVGLRVVEGCGTVTGPSTVHVNGDASANAQYTVDFGGCAAGEYTVQADACHAGDAAPAGLFGVGACPGASDGLVDTNQLDDAPRSLTVVVGSP